MRRNSKNWCKPYLKKETRFWCPSEALKVVISFQKHFQALDSDIIVIIFPKCGTTWLKALTFSIVNHNQFAREENPLLSLGPHQLVRFFEYDIYLKNPSPDLENSSFPTKTFLHPYSLCFFSTFHQKFQFYDSLHM
ncbi:hypothetical protein CRYUN_Cryun05aG0044600 [Craigia yunnanensis]